MRPRSDVTRSDPAPVRRPPGRRKERRPPADVRYFWKAPRIVESALNQRTLGSVSVGSTAKREKLDMEERRTKRVRRSGCSRGDRA
jgi:hypothetical protein